MNQKEKQKLLLREIFRAGGGPTELAQHLDIPRHRFFNWQIRGAVPVLIAAKLSKQLEVSKWGLNYPDFCALEDSPPSWEQVVKLYTFLPKRITDILLEGNTKCLKKTKKKKSRS